MSIPRRIGLRRSDYLAATWIFLLVIAGTFPVVVPFLMTDNAALAMRISRVVTLAMLFVAGFVLGRHAGHPRPAGTGLVMLLLGVALIAAVKALGGEIRLGRQVTVLAVPPVPGGLLPCIS